MRDTKTDNNLFLSFLAFRNYSFYYRRNICHLCCEISFVTIVLYLLSFFNITFVTSFCPSCLDSISIMVQNTIVESVKHRHLIHIFIGGKSH